MAPDIHNTTISLNGYYQTISFRCHTFTGARNSCRDETPLLERSHAPLVPFVVQKLS